MSEKVILVLLDGVRPDGLPACCHPPLPISTPKKRPDHTALNRQCKIIAIETICATSS